MPFLITLARISWFLHSLGQKATFPGGMRTVKMPQNLPVALGTMYYRERPTSTYTDDV
jgi:hypothetical protein